MAPGSPSIDLTSIAEFSENSHLKEAFKFEPTKTDLLLKQLLFKLKNGEGEPNTDDENIVRPSMVFNPLQTNLDSASPRIRKSNLSNNGRLS